MEIFLSVTHWYSKVLTGYFGVAIQNAGVVVGTLIVVFILWLIHGRWAAIKKLGSLFAWLIPGKSHEVWSQTIGRGGPWARTDVRGTTKDHYSRFVRLPGSLFIVPRPGWTKAMATQTEMLKHLSAKFLTTGDSYVKVVDAPLWGRLLGAKWAVVRDRTNWPVTARQIAKAAHRVKLGFGEIVIGLDGLCDPIVVDLFTPLITLAGTTRTGKSTLLYSILAQAKTIPELRLAIVDLSRIFSAKNYPGITILHTIDEVDDYLRKLEKLLAHRQAMLSEAGIDDVRRLPHCPVPYLTVIDEGGLLFAKARASDSKSATVEERLYFEVQKRFNSLVTTSGKTLIATVASFATPLQSEISLRFSSAAVKLSTYIAQDSVSDAYGSKEVLFDPGLVGGRFAIFGAARGDQAWRVSRALDRPDLHRLSKAPSKFLDDLETALGIGHSEDSPIKIHPASGRRSHGHRGSEED